jgi:hypothetical protein
MPRQEVEAKLLGKVVDDPDHCAAMDDVLARLNDALQERDRAPERSRGRIPP